MPLERKRTPAITLLMRRVAVEDRGYATPCLIFTGTPSQRYGVVGPRQSRKAVHVVAWEAAHGPVPNGLHVHHLCEQTRCCEVTHLALRTPLAHRAEHAPTHCVHGHEFTPENTLVGTQKNGRHAVRRCRACNREKNRRYRARQTSPG